MEFCPVKKTRRYICSKWKRSHKRCQHKHIKLFPGERGYRHRIKTYKEEK